eukprot:scaffold314872_cov24-Tisochrysis_lutea.AAC.2
MNACENQKVVHLCPNRLQPIVKKGVRRFRANTYDGLVSTFYYLPTDVALILIISIVPAPASSSCPSPLHSFVFGFRGPAQVNYLTLSSEYVDRASLLAGRLESFTLWVCPESLLFAFEVEADCGDVG